MEVILKSDNEEKIAKILALAKKLNIDFEKKESGIDKKAIKQKILNYKSDSKLPFGDAAEWERNIREDRELPFKK
ncbi:hypothetical protein [Sphingobacterium humi]|uniref:Uncharacterized protein n=1 Tax=Sphingobacterium humi TaxID=1796905 RepID=A0A6N8L3Y0_9SPHI|nr:hypothetical protein [Sphingobacterium humi]MVZ62482.1 hypothetical protein [Sphingobacterium humi]